MENLLFYYEVEEFAQNFVGKDGTLVNTYIDADGDVAVLYDDGLWGIGTIYVKPNEIIQDLTLEHKSMQDSSHSYNIAFTYAELNSKKYKGQDMVFIRVEKKKKGE